VVRVSRQQFDIIRRIAVLQGRSRGAVVRDLIEAVEPVLLRTTVLLERASAAPANVREGLRAAAEGAEARMLPIVEKGLGMLDLFIGSDAKGLSPEGGAAGHTRSAPPPQTPVPSNHGGIEGRRGKKEGKKGVKGVGHVDPKVTGVDPRVNIRRGRKA
jgi:hypothetical protein